MLLDGLLTFTFDVFVICIKYRFITIEKNGQDPSSAITNRKGDLTKIATPIPSHSAWGLSRSH